LRPLRLCGDIKIFQKNKFLEGNTIFNRHNRFDILADSIIYCQKHKGLKLYAYVFMLNHIHLIAFSPDIIAFVRDFKKFISKEIQKNIITTEPGILKLFDAGNKRYEFWKKTNMPKAIINEKYVLQKIEYVQTNPVRKQYVKNPEDWIWSSANPDSKILVESLF